MDNKNTNKIFLIMSVTLLLLTSTILNIPYVQADAGDLLLEFINPNPEKNDGFGRSVVSTTNDNILVGAYEDNTGANDTGSAYLFDGNDGSLLLTINNPTPEINDYFGYSVASITNGNIIVGAWSDNTKVDYTGSVYLFEGILQPIYCGEPELYYNIIEGTESSDYLVGTNSPDLMWGLGGNDLISTRGDNNCIYAGNGDDFVLAANDDDIVYGGAGDDDIMLKGTGIAYGEDGDDKIFIIVPTSGHLIDGGNDSDLCTTNAKQPINTTNCES